MQECLVWFSLFEGEEGIKECRGGESRLACHCIIPAAINSLCSEGEWIHHSNRPQGEWHQAASNQLLSATLGDVDRLVNYFFAQIIIYQSKWFIQKDQLLAKNFFLYSLLYFFSYHWFTVSPSFFVPVFGGASFWFAVLGLQVSEPQEGHICLHGSPCLPPVLCYLTKLLQLDCIAYGWLKRMALSALGAGSLWMFQSFPVPLNPCSHISDANKVLHFCEFGAGLCWFVWAKTNVLSRQLFFFFKHSQWDTYWFNKISEILIVKEGWMNSCVLMQCKHKDSLKINNSFVLQFYPPFLAACHFVFISSANYFCCRELVGSNGLNYWTGLNLAFYVSTTLRWTSRNG